MRVDVHEKSVGLSFRLLNAFPACKDSKLC